MVMAPSAILTDNQTTTTNYYKTEFVANNHGHESITNGLAAKALIQQVMKDQVASIDTDKCEPGEEDAFYVADLGEVYRQHLRWKMNLTRVKPFFAVKANPDKEVVRLLAKLGCGFDCASWSEIELVLSLGVDPSRIIYAHPCKTKSYLRYAERVGVKQMTFDNAAELYKIKNCFPGAEIVLRISTDDSTSLCPLSTKFGVDVRTAEVLLRLAKELNLNVVGVSFHVGSGASDPSAFTKAVQDARTVFDKGTTLGFDMHLLDVGGGFSDETFETFTVTLNEALGQYFPGNVKIIAEPGRYYTSNAFTLATNIIARREVSNGMCEDRSCMLYLNDGVYGNFSNIIFDHQQPVPQILYCASGPTKAVEYSIWGHTCDGIDMITDRCTLPAKLDIGDWLFFENMGAYTKCSATKFNGFRDDHDTIYISSEPGAAAMLGY